MQFLFQSQTRILKDLQVQAARDGILSIDNLVKKNFRLVNWCCLCWCDEETLDHLLLYCKFVHTLWSEVFSLFGVQWVLLKTVVSLLFAWWNWLGIHSSNVRNMVLPCLMWLTWKERNARTFEDIERTVDLLNSLLTRTLKQEQEHAHEVHCSRERSRAAWKIIDEYLMPFVEREDYQISSKCRLHPNKDLFRDQELHKIHVDINEWRCGYCKKSFRAEKFLDQHFDNRHYNLLNVSHSKCLADLCGALHCDVVMNTKSTKTKCNPAATARNRHLCESLADSCFPANQGPSAIRLHDLFLRQFCDAHTCSGKQKPFSKGGKKETSVFYLAIAILTLMLLPIFYLIVYLHQSEMRKDTQELRRISKVGQKNKTLIVG